MGFRRIIQVFSLSLFLFLLAWAAITATADWTPDFFLRMDPSLALITTLAARVLTSAFLPALVVLAVGFMAGRVFCGWICPMGTTLDGADKLVRCRPAGRIKGKQVKYLVLFFLIGAALAGLNYVFLASPLSLITRFYGLVVYPVVSLFADAVHVVLAPLADRWGWYSFVFAEIKTPKFATVFFVLLCFAVLFGSAFVAPRFWCRYVCPSGALLALTSVRPLIRRRVSEDCIECGQCVRSCPMAAIDPDDPTKTDFRECIVCQTCRDVCPVDAVAFQATKSVENEADAPALPERRRFVAAGLAGAGTALVSLSSLHTAFSAPGEGQVKPPLLLRPPGARPEPDFLRKCIRCGECMAACPTNTLQPIWFKAGWEALFSPGITPVRGYCDPKCRTCGLVCPTDAIRTIPEDERVWVKTGTAVINRQKCLAWEHDKACMVCDEVCRFNAITFRKSPESSVAVPYIIEEKCSGCGYCEYYCPVQNQKAIIVTPMGELRLAKGSYQAAARAQGLDLSIDAGEQQGYPEVQPGEPGTAPGFTEPGEGETAPGFTEPEDTSPAPGFTNPD